MMWLDTNQKSGMWYFDPWIGDEFLALFLSLTSGVVALSDGVLSFHPEQRLPSPCGLLLSQQERPMSC